MYTLGPWRSVGIEVRGVDGEVLAVTKTPDDARLMALALEMWDTLRRYTSGEYAGDRDIFHSEADALVERGVGLRG